VEGTLVIGKLQRVPLREVWRHEALGLTRWLEENIDVLNEVLGLSLSDVEREASAGTFNVDLTARDAGGDLVIIENQLEKSDHDHLGKILTYLVALDAKKAIWIVADPRPEHVGAINWLNETSAASFYLLKIEGVKISDSPPAPLLTLIVGPSKEGREIGEKKEELAERYDIRKEFWSRLLDRARNRTTLHASISPGKDSWIETSAGKSGLSYSYTIRQHDGQIEFYIDRGKQEENKTIFATLHESKVAIEADFGETLEWQRLDEKRASRIRKIVELGGWRDEAKWPEIQEAMIDAMIRLEKALRPHITKLRI
jgi:hypothetical protein